MRWRKIFAIEYGTGRWGRPPILMIRDSGNGAGPDGLKIIRKLLRQAEGRLTPGGYVLIEVGGLRRAIDREFAALKPRWLATADGANCVCRIEARRLAGCYLLNRPPI